VQPYDQRESYRLLQERPKFPESPPIFIHLTLISALESYGDEIEKTIYNRHRIIYKHFNYASQKDPTGYEKILLPILFDIVDISIETNSLDYANGILEKLRLLHPHDARINYFMGILFCFKLQYNEAYSCFESADADNRETLILTDDQYDYLCTLWMGCAEYTGKKLKIEQLPQRPLKTGTNQNQNSNHYEETRSQKNDYDTHMTNARKYLSNFSLRAALRHVQKALALSPNDICALVMAEDICSELNLNKELIVYYRRHVTIAPDYIVYYKLGVALTADYLEEEAIEAFEEALKFDPNSIPALMYQGINLVILAQHDCALDVFNRIIEIFPTSSIGYCYRGMVFSHLVNAYRDKLIRRLEDEQIQIESVHKLRKDYYDQLLFEKRWNVDGKILSFGGMKSEITKCYLNITNLCDNHTTFEVDMYHLFVSKLAYPPPNTIYGPYQIKTLLERW